MSVEIREIWTNTPTENKRITVDMDFISDLHLGSHVFNSSRKAAVQIYFKSLFKQKIIFYIIRFYKWICVK